MIFDPVPCFQSQEN